MAERPEGLEAHREEALAAFDPPEPEPEALDAAIDRASAAGRDFARQYDGVLRRLIELEGASVQRAVMFARNRTRLPAEVLVPLLVHMAERNRIPNPRACRLWAELAVERAETELPATDPFRARAWAEVANAQRIHEEYSTARRSFDRALALLGAEGGRNPGLRGEIYSLLGSLEYALHRPEQALEWLDQAARCFRRARLPHELRKVGHQQAIVRIFRGDFREAYTELEQLLASMTQSSETEQTSDSILAPCHEALNLITEIALTTRSSDEKRQILTGFVETIGDLVALYADAPPAWRTRKEWMTGRLLYAEESIPASRRHFKVAMQEFLDLGRPASAAAAALDLALTYAHEGRVGKVREVAAAACTALKAAGLASDAWAAHRTLLHCDVSALETTIHDGLRRLRGASLKRTPRRA